MNIRVRSTLNQLRQDYNGNPIAMAIASLADELFIELPRLIDAINNVAASIDRSLNEKDEDLS